MTLLQEVFKKSLFMASLFAMANVMSADVSVGVPSDDSFSFGKGRVTLSALKGKVRKPGSKPEVITPAQPVPVIAQSNDQKITQSSVSSTIKFHVKNELGRKAFIVPFAYVKRFLTDTWHWVNLSTLELENGAVGLVDVGVLADEDGADTVFGAFRLCNTREEALNATYELSEDFQRIDVGLFSNLKNKTAVLRATKYGVEGERLSYEVSPSQWKKELPPLDFRVLNTHNAPVFVSAFFYGKGQDCDSVLPWRFSKGSVCALKPGESAVLKMERIKDPYDWNNVKGYLAVFHENEGRKAENATYELLKPEEKIALGPLSQLIGKQVALTSRLYGNETVFDISTSPVPSAASGTTTVASS